MKGLMLVAVLLLAILPAMANDLKDFLQSPGSETLEIGQGIANFATDTLIDPDGGGFGFLANGSASAWYLNLSKGVEWTTGVPQLPKIKAAGIMGLTIYNTDPATQDVQLIGGIGASLVNFRGAELRVGARFCSSDLGDKVIDLGPLGRVHYQWPAVEIAMPIGG